MREFLLAIKAWCLRKENLTLMIAVSIAFGLMLGVTIFFLLKPAKSKNLLDRATTETVETVIRHPLTGAVLTETLTQLPRVFGVMIENSADAWPLSGLEAAFLVIEAPVEGDIPRFEAFFYADNQVDKIGPVRSARPYYVDWATELEAVYAHVGGSPAALDLIETMGVNDLNEFWNGKYFWRDTRRWAPHNVYTSTLLLKEADEVLSLRTPQYSVWQFKDNAPVVTEPVSLAIDWGAGDVYDILWEYQVESNGYLRKQHDETVRMQTDEVILANNVVVIATDITVIDSLGRRQLETLGSGDALIIQDGKLILGKWQKDSSASRLRFYSLDNQEIQMNAGKTWVEVVSSLAKVKTFTTQLP